MKRMLIAGFVMMALVMILSGCVSTRTIDLDSHTVTQNEPIKSGTITGLALERRAADTTNEILRAGVERDEMDAWRSNRMEAIRSGTVLTPAVVTADGVNPVIFQNESHHQRTYTYYRQGSDEQWEVVVAPRSEVVRHLGVGHYRVQVFDYRGSLMRITIFDKDRNQRVTYTQVPMEVHPDITYRDGSGRGYFGRFMTN